MGKRTHPAPGQTWKMKTNRRRETIVSISLDKRQRDIAVMESGAKVPIDELNQKWRAV